jgi:hypothetical protein
VLVACCVGNSLCDELDHLFRGGLGPIWSVPEVFLFTARYGSADYIPQLRKISELYSNKVIIFIVKVM